METKRFGGRLRELREGAEKSLRAVADHMKWTPAYVSDMELNRRNPPATDKIREIALFLKVDPCELLDLAAQEKERIEIPLSLNKPHGSKFALALARSWDELSDDDFDRLNEALKRR
jgi:transcriptional regulator with XRE-family HTH domain